VLKCSAEEGTSKVLLATNRQQQREGEDGKTLAFRQMAQAVWGFQIRKGGGKSPLIRAIVLMTEGVQETRDRSRVEGKA